MNQDDLTNKSELTSVRGVSNSVTNRARNGAPSGSLIQDVKGALKVVIKSCSEEPLTDLDMSIESKSADKELKAVTSEKSKSCATAFTKKLLITFQLSRTRSGQRKTCSML